MKLITSICAYLVLSTAVLAQSASTNSQLPVEATADDLQVNSANNTAVFSGNARVVQGDLNLTAQRIAVSFDADASEIKTVNATGGVKYTNSAESAEAQSAKFDVTSQTIVFTGNVTLKQANTILKGDLLTYNITTRKSQMSGNVKTVYKPN